MGSLYGQDMLTFVADFKSHAGSAHEMVLYLLTHGHRYPLAHALASLGFFDRAAFEVLNKNRGIPVTAAPAADSAQTSLVMYVNSLGRLHIRKVEDERLSYDIHDKIIEIGYLNLAPDIMSELLDDFANAMAVEERQFKKVKRALDALHTTGALADVLEQVIDHVEHVESVGFYAGDKFFARIDRFVNLIEGKGAEGFLPRLRDKPYLDWSRDEILIVAALHALFLSGRAVRFEEFNGMALTATALWEKLYGLLRFYRDAGCACEVPVDADLFDLSRIIRDQSFKAEGSGWLRYRWIYGLNFQKNERILSSTRSTEDPSGYLREFGDDYEELVGHMPAGGVAEREFFRELAQASLEQDVRGVACCKCSDAAKGWIEYLIEKIVASAVLATGADYGMSSSLRDISRLVESDEAQLMKVIHALQTADFFTCFVSKGFRSGLEKSVADTIADSVQRRMMFNRWHFIPGNFERSSIDRTRHWYYPPVLPDIAIHSDVHRGGHARAQVKFSVRAPGPDMSRPPLMIANHPYRGFYDVRVVRMTGREFTTEEMLRTRRRTLWMESLYSVLVDYLMTHAGHRLPIVGFQPGEFLDIETHPMHAVESPPGEKKIVASAL